MSTFRYRQRTPSTEQMSQVRYGSRKGRCPSSLHNLNRVARPYVAPPGTPKDRVQLLRRTFLQTLRDPDHLADAKKVALESDPSRARRWSASSTGCSGWTLLALQLQRRRWSQQPLSDAR